MFPPVVRRYDAQNVSYKIIINVFVWTKLSSFRRMGCCHTASTSESVSVSIRLTVCLSACPPTCQSMSRLKQVMRSPCIKMFEPPFYGMSPKRAKRLMKMHKQTFSHKVEQELNAGDATFFKLLRSHSVKQSHVDIAH